MALLLIFSCQKESGYATVNCVNYKTALLNFDSKKLAIEIDKLCQDLEPNPVANDAIGHLKNFQLLIERLNTNCQDIVASNLCYACIETLPVQSQIKIVLDSLGHQVERIVAISTPEDAILKTVGMHAY